MSSTIAALTSGAGGISMTGDASGILNLNSNGTTVVAVTSTGVAVTGTLAATGAVSGTTGTFTGTGKFATTIGVGNATPSASGSGITFPATQSASSDANTLDDYEEGTFTPTIIGTTAAGVGTYTTQTGTYTKIGRQVSFTIFVAWSAHTGTGSLKLSNLPFTSIAGYNPGVVFGYINNLTLTASNTLTAFVEAIAQSIVFFQYPTGGGGATAVAIDAAADLRFSGTYFV